MCFDVGSSGLTKPMCIQNQIHLRLHRVCTTPRLLRLHQILMLSVSQSVHLIDVCTYTHTRFLHQVTVKFNLLHTEPEIEEFPQDTHVTEGEAVFFTVKVNGQPQPTLIWYRDGKEIQNDYSQEIKADGSLSLRSTETRHTGVYQLVAKNSVGSAEKEVKLFVHIEGEETPAIQRKSIDLSPVPLAQFGVYVSNNHDHTNRGFRDLYGVSVHV